VASNPNTRFVRASRVNVREGPSPDAAVLATLEAQLPVFVEAREGDWWLVRTSLGQVGFVRSDLLEQR
jgi:SH3-like domain-containing protein